MIVVAAGRVPQARRLRQAPPAVATAIGVAIPAPTAAAIVVIVVVISEVVVSLTTMIQVTATTTAAAANRGSMRTQRTAAEAAVEALALFIGHRAAEATRFGLN